MVWNIEIQLAALLLAFVVAGMCLGQKRLNFAAERSFTKLLFFVIVSIILDICSVFAMNYREYTGDILCSVICNAYLLSVTNVACQAAWFAVAEIRHSFSRFWVSVTALPLIVQFVLAFVFPLEYIAYPGGIYAYGVPVLATYFFCAVYLVSNFFMVVILREQINLKRRFAIYFWMGCWFLLGLIQAVNNELLLLSFAMAIGCMYMYCKLENPEYHLDFSTNVFNAKGFDMLMAEHLDSGDSKSLVSFMVGDMKMINEIFGAHAVDRIITSIADFADGIPGSVLFRLEDNLFSLLFDKKEDAEKALELLTKRFSGSWSVGGISVEIMVSLSYIDDISSFKKAGDLEEVVHYFAQESTKLPFGEILYVNETELEIRSRNKELQHALEWAIQNNGVEVYYQPVYNIKEGRFNSLEALTRIRDEHGTLIYPLDFIESAEKNGMILRLGEIVFRKVCEFIQRMHIETYGIDYVGVNLSVVQCLQEDLARQLKNIMGEYQVPPYRIYFEITESAVVNSRKTIYRNMRDLIAYGSCFSLDDYGSGYSNLSGVVTLPLKVVKIDKLLVDNYFLSDKVKTATEYTIEMIHKLGMEIIVEGIETEEKYLAFKKLGVEYVQGFYFSKPLPKDQVLNYIQEWL